MYPIKIRNKEQRRSSWLTQQQFHHLMMHSAAWSSQPGQWPGYFSEMHSRNSKWQHNFTPMQQWSVDKDLTDGQLQHLQANITDMTQHHLTAVFNHSLIHRLHSIKYLYIHSQLKLLASDIQAHLATSGSSECCCWRRCCCSRCCMAPASSWHCRTNSAPVDS